MAFIKKILLYSTIITTSIYANEAIDVCTDNSDWAPYVYYERDSLGNKKDKFMGASVDALNAISKKTGLKFNISGYPWKRCLTSVENFERVKKFEAFMDGTNSKERDKKFLRTDPFYSTNVAIFYSIDKYPNGIPISTLKDLIPYKACGMAGYNYEEYTKVGIKIDTTSKSASNLIKKVLIGRCDLFTFELETIFGDISLGNYKMPQKLKYIQIDDRKTDNFYFWISRQSPRAQELINTMNKAIRELKKEGKWEDIYKNYIPTGSGL